MSDKDSDIEMESDGEVEVIEVKASNALVPNLTISVDKDAEESTVEFQEEKDDKEESKEEESNVEVKLESKAFSHTKIYENKALQDIGITAEEAKLRKMNRTKRFQSPMLRDEVEPETTDKEAVEDLINKVQEYNKANDIFKEIRLEAVFLRGLDDMSTEDIFSFFGDHYPSHIEWIDDTSCNVVWKDEKSAAEAIIAMSKPVKPRTKSTATDTKPEDPGEEGKKQDENDDDLDLMESDEEVEMEVEEEKNGSASLPFTNELRRCKKPFEKNGRKVLLKMRFADVNDKKTLGGAKKSQYYRKYGNPNYGNMRGILSRSFMKRYHGRAAKREFEDYKPDDAERSSETSTKSEKKTKKRMYSEKDWKDSKKARLNDGEESDSSDDEEDREKQDRELMNASAKDLSDAVPSEKRDLQIPEDTMIADRIAKKVEAARRSLEDDDNSGNLNIKIKGGGGVWARLGQRQKHRDRGNDQVLEQDREKKTLPKSLKDRLGVRR